MYMNTKEMYNFKAKGSWDEIVYRIFLAKKNASALENLRQAVTY